MRTKRITRIRSLPTQQGARCSGSSPRCSGNCARRSCMAGSGAGASPPTSNCARHAAMAASCCTSCLSVASGRVADLAGATVSAPSAPPSDAQRRPVGRASNFPCLSVCFFSHASFRLPNRKVTQSPPCYRVAAGPANARQLEHVLERRPLLGAKPQLRKGEQPRQRRLVGDRRETPPSSLPRCPLEQGRRRA